MIRLELTGAFAWFLVVVATSVDAQIGTGPQPDRAESGRLIVSPNQLSQKQSLEYNLRDNYCWLLAHTSVRAGNEIIINDGMAKYLVSTRLNGSTTSQEVEVPDLNAWTMSLLLDKDFPVNEPPLELWQPRNALTHPPANRGGLWSNGTHVFSVGGHFYNGSRYMNSYYAVPQDSIPPFEIWAGDVQRRQWAKVDHVATPGERLDRTVSGAATCVVNEGEDVNKCYYLGGYKSTRTSSQLPQNWALSQRAMLEFNPETLTIRNDSKSTDGYGDPDMGYQFGTLHHIPVGCGSGILVSLMAEQSPLNLVSETDDDLRGPAVNTTTIMVYDIDSRTWYKQKTARGLEDERPPPRTRYCGDVVYSESTKSWDLWIYGGQFVNDPDSGMEDVHVLTMPKFQWVRLDLKTPSGVPSPKAIRGHTCHAVNSQLLVLGGTTRGLEVNQGASCQPSPEIRTLTTLLDLNTLSWSSTFSAKPREYRSPSLISDSAGGIENRNPQFGWGSERLRELFEVGVCEKKDEGMGTKQKVGVGVGVGVGVLVILAGVVWWWRRRREKRAGGQGDNGDEYGMVGATGPGNVAGGGGKVRKKESLEDAGEFPIG